MNVNIDLIIFWRFSSIDFECKQFDPSVDDGFLVCLVIFGITLMLFIDKYIIFMCFVWMCKYTYEFESLCLMYISGLRRMQRQRETKSTLLPYKTRKQIYNVKNNRTTTTTKMFRNKIFQFDALCLSPFSVVVYVCVDLTGMLRKTRTDGMNFGNQWSDQLVMDA